MHATAASSRYDIDKAKRARQGSATCDFWTVPNKDLYRTAFPLRKSCNPANLLKLFRLRGAFERHGLTKKVRKCGAFFDDCAADG